MGPLSIGLGVAGLAGQILGGSISGHANDNIAQMLKKQDEQNEAFYNNSVNRTFLDTNAAKAILERVRKQYEDANQVVDNKAVVTGATPEAVVAGKTSNNEALNDAVSSIAGQATAYQDAKEQQYQNQKNAIVAQQMGLEANKAQNAANLVGNAGNLLENAALTAFNKKENNPASGTAAAIASRENNGQGAALNLVSKLGEREDLLNRIFQ